MNCVDCQKKIDNKFVRCYDCNLVHIEELKKITNCLHCNKALVKIGNERKNGAPIIDWETRVYHKKCYKEKTDLDQLKRMMKLYCPNVTL